MARWQFTLGNRYLSNDFAPFSPLRNSPHMPIQSKRMYHFILNGYTHWFVKRLHCWKIRRRCCHTSVLLRIWHCSVDLVSFLCTTTIIQLVFKYTSMTTSYLTYLPWRSVTYYTVYEQDSYQTCLVSTTRPSFTELWSSGMTCLDR